MEIRSRCCHNLKQRRCWSCDFGKWMISASLRFLTSKKPVRNVIKKRKPQLGQMLHTPLYNPIRVTSHSGGKTRMSEQVEVLLTSNFQESFQTENLKATRTEIGTKSSANSRLKTLQGQGQGQGQAFILLSIRRLPLLPRAYFSSFNFVLFYCSLHQCLVITITSL